MFKDKEDLQETIDEVIEDFQEKYEKIGVGRNRIVFSPEDRNFVLKVPRNYTGTEDNYRERQRWHLNNVETNEESEKVVHYAHPYLFHLKEIPILYMEEVDGWLNLDEVNELIEEDRKWMWIKAIDCMQVGPRKSDGKIVAFDYAD